VYTATEGEACGDAPALRTATLSDREFEQFAHLITERLGIRMAEGKRTMLEGRLARRIRQLKLSSFEQYRRYLFHPANEESEFVHFADVVTTNKTDFFREPTHFDYLAGAALPTLGRSSRTHSWAAKVWCAGCSSGEEAWTLAMVMSEHGAKNPEFDFSILATDISTRVLVRAREAVYSHAVVEPVPLALRKRYLLSSRDASLKLVRVAPELREKVSFDRLNFMDRTYDVKTTFDVIFFRNVMIYFSKSTQEAVVNRLCARLRPGGYLFVGHSESLAGLSVPLRQVALAIYRRND
jgi:chemotaxis protein methyltransferase CheR